MTWDQARQLKAAGVDVGSHSLSHIALAPQTPELIRHELHTARELLQRRIGDHSPHFSYPYGRPASMSPEVESVLLEMGYHCGLTLEQEIVRCERCNLTALPRLIVSAQVGRVLFALWQRFIR
jgi:peptidoglycan/xylan/chitin deacetylase (PgdA/CDA1 family)